MADDDLAAKLVRVAREAVDLIAGGRLEGPESMNCEEAAPARREFHVWITERPRAASRDRVRSSNRRRSVWLSYHLGSVRCVQSERRRHSRA